MLSPLHNHDLITHADDPLLQRSDLHTQARRLASLVNDPILTHSGTGLVAVRNSGSGVDVGQFAARGAAGNVEFQSADAGL